MRTCYIYELSGEDGVPFYIGSSVSIKIRGKQHRSAGRQFHSLNIIDECHIDDRIVIERMYIQLYLSWGFDLHNMCYNKNKRIKRKSTKLLKDIKPWTTCPKKINELLQNIYLASGRATRPNLRLQIENAIKNKANYRHIG